MSREKILEYFKDINHAYNDCTRYDTLKHMLDELQEPCDDAISRQAAIDALDCINGIEEVLRALPPVTPQYTDAEIQKMQDLEFAEIQKAYEIGKDEGSSENPNKWIPVSERLPEEKQAVLVWCPEFKNTYCAYRLKDQWWVFGAFAQIVPNAVLAWMPLPLPYNASPTGAESEGAE